MPRSAGPHYTTRASGVPAGGSPFGPCYASIYIKSESGFAFYAFLTCS